eukprot:1925838-Rhodomonas_salina.1
MWPRTIFLPVSICASSGALLPRVQKALSELLQNTALQGRIKIVLFYDNQEYADSLLGDQVAELREALRALGDKKSTQVRPLSGFAHVGPCALLIDFSERRLRSVPPGSAGFRTCRGQAVSLAVLQDALCAYVFAT